MDYETRLLIDQQLQDVAYAPWFLLFLYTQPDQPLTLDEHTNHTKLVYSWFIYPSVGVWTIVIGPI